MSYGDMIADAIVGAIVWAFVAGLGAALGLWASWHFVLSHLRVSWV